MINAEEGGKKCSILLQIDLKVYFDLCLVPILEFLNQPMKNRHTS